MSTAKHPQLLFTPDHHSSAVPDNLLGGKGENLARLEQTGHGADWNVPPWIAITSHALHHFTGIAPEEETVENWRLIISQLSIPVTFIEQLASALHARGISPTSLLAVRSSALGEDGSGLSYAGQLDSFLYVRQDELVEAIRSVWLSAFSDHVVQYRRHNGLPDLFPGVAVLIQEMVDADVSGVAFGLDPVTGRTDRIVISSTFGLGEGLVSGELDADQFTLAVSSDRTTSATSSVTILDQSIARKTGRVVFDRNSGKGTVLQELPAELAEKPTLQEKQIDELGEMVLALNGAFGTPQDCEWAYVGDQLYLLQSRPVTAVGSIVSDVGAADRFQSGYGEIGEIGGTKIIWDNSNIIESYSGVTTPLTFSFIKGVYTEVYKELTRILGVQESTIEANRSVFTMLGLIRGRVYYNLLNWYRLLALLPGYHVNAEFMEGMMGVKERLEERPQVVPPKGSQFLRLLISIYRLILNLLRLPSQIRDFHELVNRTLEPYERKSFANDSPQEIVTHYRYLERELLQRWRTPILNDFYAMIFHGLLKKQIEGMFNGAVDAGTLHNDLISGEGGIISTEPIRRIRELAEQISTRPSLREIILHTSDQESLTAMETDPTVGPMLEEYLMKFGDRYAGELRLETITPKEDRRLVVGAIRGHLQQVLNEGPEQEGGRSGPGAIRKKAEAAIARRIGSNPVRRLLFRWILKGARERIRNRENLRFERTRVFGVVRNLMLTIGRRFEEAGIIANHRDIFYLGLDEIFGLIDGTALSFDPRSVIDQRQEEFDRYRSTPSPPDRLETVGPVVVSVLREQDVVVDAASSDRTRPVDILRGTACCPGRVTGPVRIVRDPSQAGDLRGHIMVAERTDPGWGPLFPLATAILVERGSLLSHSAIVAREMGIPAIVAIPDLLNTLVDGEVVTMDGATGLIERHGTSPEELVVEENV